MDSEDCLSCATESALLGGTAADDCCYGSFTAQEGQLAVASTAALEVFSLRSGRQHLTARHHTGLPAPLLISSLTLSNLYPQRLDVLICASADGDIQSLRWRSSVWECHNVAKLEEPPVAIWMVPQVRHYSSCLQSFSLMIGCASGRITCLQLRCDYPRQNLADADGWQLGCSKMLEIRSGKF